MRRPHHTNSKGAKYKIDARHESIYSRSREQFTKLFLFSTTIRSRRLLFGHCSRSLNFSAMAIFYKN
jgi:hypothetical protein